MDKSKILLGLSILSFVAILFAPSGSDYWIYLMIFGIIFGIVWFTHKGS